MSLIMTESWMWAPRYTGLDNANGTDTEGGKQYVASGAPARMGYVFYQVIGSGVGWAFRDDPVVPARCSICYSASNPSTNSFIGAALGIPLPPRGGSAYVIGFSLFIPSSYSSALTSTVVHGGFANVGVANSGGSNANTVNAFFIRQDLAVTSAMSGTPQSPVRLQAGAVNYVEVRYDGTTTSVWVDDILVNQHTANYGNTDYFILGVSRISNFQLLPARWAFSNFYALLEDGTAPNARLGKTTRVLGKRPTSDVVVDFVRPPEASTNAEVAAQNVVATPSSFLIAQEVGDTDLYSAPDLDVVGSPVVHAVVVKALAANNATAVHGAKVVVDSSSTEAESAETNLPVLGGFQLVRGAFPVDPATGLAWEGLAAASAAFGLRASS